MVDYCIQDTVVNEAIYKTVKAQADEHIEARPLFAEAIRVEHKMSKLSAQQTRDGWLFNFDGCQKLIDEITDKMTVIENEIEPHLSPITRLIDKEAKTPRNSPIP